MVLAVLKKHLTTFYPYLIFIFLIQSTIGIGRLLTSGMRNAQIVRLHDVINLQLIMLLLSNFLFQKTSRFADRFIAPTKDTLKSIIILFLFLSHTSWLLFYIYLPDDSILSLICFTCLSIFIHLIFFLGIGAFINLLRAVFFFRWLPSLDSIAFVALSFFLSIIFTLAGLAVTQFAPTVRRLDIPVKDLPSSFNGFSIVLLTDLHIGPTVREGRIKLITSLTNSLRPDMIAVVGDLVDGFVTNIARHTFPLASLKSKHGVFYVTGNHEYYHGNVDNWLNLFNTRLNFTVLQNSHKKLYADDGSYICLAGVNDYFTGRLKLTNHKMNGKQAIKDCGVNVPTILLVHQPNGAVKLMSEIDIRVDLILSGHTHGGQLYVFWPIAYMSYAYFHGLYKMKNDFTKIYVSSGVNYWGPPVKMRGLCEITHITLRPES